MKGNIIFTFDDVLAYTTWDLYNFLENDYTRYSKILDLYTLRTKKDIYNRECENLLAFLLKTELMKKFSNNFSSLLISDLIVTIYNDYYSKFDMRKLEWTNLSKKVLGNPLFVENKGIDNIYILFKYKTNKEKEIKLQFLQNQFKDNPKIHIIDININDEYYDIIKKNISNWDLVVTDDKKTVEELSKLDIDHKEFLMPKYGYTQIGPELFELIKQKSGSISYYDM